MSKLLVVTLLAVVAVAHAQYVPWADELKVNATSTTVNLCKSGSDTNCYEFESNAGIKITGYSVSASRFPCTSGTTQSSFSWDNSVALKPVTCQVSCDGFGCKQGTVELCGADFGIDCSKGELKFTSTGKVGDCQSGLGSYTVTITCGDQFTLYTYLKY
jgi:hypothetical protein